MSKALPPQSQSPLPRLRLEPLLRLFLLYFRHDPRCFDVQIHCGRAFRSAPFSAFNILISSHFCCICCSALLASSYPALSRFFLSTAGSALRLMAPLFTAAPVAAPPFDAPAGTSMLRICSCHKVRTLRTPFAFCFITAEKGRSSEG